MITKATKFIKNSEFSINIKVDLTPQEKELVKSFGDPDVQVGGSFVLDTVSFTLPEKLVKLTALGSHTQKFSGLDLGLVEAKSRGKVYTTIMMERVDLTIETLRSQVDDFTGEIVTTM